MRLLKYMKYHVWEENNSEFVFSGAKDMSFPALSLLIMNTDV